MSNTRATWVIHVQHSHVRFVTRAAAPPHWMFPSLVPIPHWHDQTMYSWGNYTYVTCLPYSHIMNWNIILPLITARLVNSSYIVRFKVSYLTMSTTLSIFIQHDTTTYLVYLQRVQVIKWHTCDIPSHSRMWLCEGLHITSTYRPYAW